MSRYIDADVRVGVPIKEAVIIEKTELTDECIDKIAEAVVQKLADRKTEPQTEDEYITELIKKKCKTEPQTEDWHDDCNTCRWQEDNACTIPCCDYEPQTERSE